MRFGLIGFGAWGKLHAEAIRKAPGAELAAIACASEASAQAARAAYPQARVDGGWRARVAGAEASAQAAGAAYPQARVDRDWRALVADPSLEAVDIVVPNHLHAEI